MKVTKKIIIFPLIFLIILLIALTTKYAKLNLQGNPQTESPKTTLGEIFRSPSGEIAFASGNCNYNSDCITTGCSAHICANHEIITTCEVVIKPQELGYSCVCSENLCVWQRKFDEVEVSE